MIEVETKHCLQGFEEESLREGLSKISSLKEPEFAVHEPDIQGIKEFSREFHGFEKLIVIGAGGSISGLKAFSTALLDECGEKRLEILNTVDPERIAVVKEHFKPKNSLVCVSSKSGNTVTVLEAMSAFDSYRKIAVTTEGSGALFEICKKSAIPFYPHPPLGGRFSSISAVSFLPLTILGFDVNGIFSGAEKMFKKCSLGKGAGENPALRLAAAFYLLEMRGFTDIFFPVYSSRLAGFESLFTQLVHETYCKGGKGQTVFSGEGPETQHHSNQRFFGGRKNACALFLCVDKFKGTERVSIKPEFRGIPLRNGQLGKLNGVSLGEALHFEFLGTKKDAEEKGIPHAVLRAGSVSENNLGELAALMEYFAYYSAVLRNVNPFDQPEVERSKQISFELRKG